MDNLLFKENQSMMIRIIVVILGLFVICEGKPVNFREITTEKILSKQNILPPDHRDAVKLEADGHLNRDFQRELFFGEEHEKIEPHSFKEAQAILTDLFNKVDTNNDKHLSELELTQWLRKKINEHLEAATLENMKAFKLLDHNADGLIVWREFLIDLMTVLGHNKSLAERYVDNYSLIPLGQEEATAMSKNQFRWAASDGNMDNSLNATEFLTFRHPELSDQTIMRHAEEVLTSLDSNGDSLLTEQEFVQLPRGEVELPFPGMVNDDEVWVAERRREFRTKLDTNRDGTVTKEELSEYVRPNGLHTAQTEARSLMDIADKDQDGVLSLQEFLADPSLVIGSKMVNTAAKFHEDL